MNKKEIYPKDRIQKVTFVIKGGPLFYIHDLERIFEEYGYGELFDINIRLEKK